MFSITSESKTASPLTIGQLLYCSILIIINYTVIEMVTGRYSFSIVTISGIVLLLAPVEMVMLHIRRTTLRPSKCAVSLGWQKMSPSQVAHDKNISKMNQTSFSRLVCGPEKGRFLFFFSQHGKVYLLLVYLVTAFVPSLTACLASSPGKRRRTAVWISLLVMVDRLL